eukprot:764676-Hanusia_phi.AAC.3
MLRARSHRQALNPAVLCDWKSRSTGKSQRCLSRQIQPQLSEMLQVIASQRSSRTGTSNGAKLSTAGRSESGHAGLSEMLPE